MLYQCSPEPPSFSLGLARVVAMKLGADVPVEDGLCDQPSCFFASLSILSPPGSRWITFQVRQTRKTVHRGEGII